MGLDLQTKGLLPRDLAFTLSRNASKSSTSSSVLKKNKKRKFQCQLNIFHYEPEQVLSNPTPARGQIHFKTTWKSQEGLEYYSLEMIWLLTNNLTNTYLHSFHHPTTMMTMMNHPGILGEFFYPFLLPLYSPTSQ